MTKKQKIWLWIFIAMFVVPEILWGPIFGYTSFTKNIFEVDNRVELLLVLFMQLFGVILFLISLIKNASRSILYWLMILISVLVLVKGVFVFYIFFATYGMWS